MEKEDRLSGLPDELIHHVMSFLSTKVAVQTCVLSKRWLFLWQSLPYLNFDSRTWFYGDDFDNCPWLRGADSDSDDDDNEYEECEESKERFNNFVSQMLLRRRPTNLVKLRFSCSNFVDSLVLESLICYALQHKVQVLDIRSDLLEDITFPRCPSSCELLTTIKLESISLTSSFILKLHLSALQSSHFVRYAFMDQDFYTRIFSNCPNLQTLKFVDSTFNGFNNLSIRAPNLKYLEFSYSRGAWPVYPPRKLKVAIDAPKLTTFKFVGHYSPMWCLADNQLASLDEIYFDLRPNNVIQDDFPLWSNTLKEFSHAKSLTLSLQMLKALCKLLEESQLQFANLKYLKLIVRGNGKDLVIRTSLLNRPFSSSPLLKIFW